MSPLAPLGKGKGPQKVFKEGGLPIISNDDIERKHLSWTTIEGIEKFLGTNQPFIINTSKRGEPGSHWITGYWLGTQLIIYDPLGASNKRLNNALLMRHQPYLIQEKAQDDLSYFCGYFASAVARLWKKTPKTKEALEKAVHDLFGNDKTPTLEDELRVLQKYNDPALVDGGQLWSDIVSRIKGITRALTGTRDNLQPESRKYMDQYGDVPIIALAIGRKPLGETYSTILSLFQKLTFTKATIPVDKLFHVYFIVTLQNGIRLRYEKYEQLSIKPYSPVQGEEIIYLSAPRGLTIRQMLETTVRIYGKENIYHYSAFGYKNCQNFVFNNISANSMTNFT
jgi:hypothetical protein